ncbi:transglutaminase domain-containing protein [Chloroflexia bacterium SDU3-3]|nr:transglutaminase domain-containing protein [Chloroflexia bacterium SDU3-3]
MIATRPPAQPYVPWYQRVALPELLPSALMAALMLWSVIQSIAQANWADGLGVLVLVALPALLVGLVFARLAWLPGWLAHWLSATLGVAWAVQCVGPLLQAEVATAYGQTMGERLGSWSDRGSEIVLRTMSLVRIVQAGGRGEDIVLFIVALSLLSWALGYATSWMLFRARWTWPAVLINAVVILVNYTYTAPKPTTLFFIFLSAALLLIVHQQIVAQQRLWSAALIDFPEWMPLRFVMAASLVVGGTALITSILPGEVSIAQAARTWQVMSAPFTTLRESWETAFSTINAPPGTTGSGFFTRSMRVGGARSLGDEVVMQVQSDEFDYWRAITRDRYTGRTWENTVGEAARAQVGATTAEGARTPLDPGALASLPQELLGRTLITQTVTLSSDRADSMLVMGGQFRSAGIPTLVEHTFDATSTPPLPNFEETSGVFSQTPLQATQVYTVASYLSTVDQASLRAAGEAYPDWVRTRYLQLPETMSQRVAEQAHQIVRQASATSPYDKAVAIQAFLRTYVYDEKRQAPPTDTDWADYFIFESKRGYCDDFATAMIVMLRAEGVPARLAQGYAGGSFDQDLGAYVVRESVAHSWPEVYFPGFGWQRFEPTPASYADLPVRPAVSLTATPLASTTPLTSTSTLGDREREDLELQQRIPAPGGPIPQADAAQQRALATALAILAALGALVALFFILLNIGLRGLSPTAAIYTRLARLAGWAGIRHEPHLTPAEYGQRIGEALPEQREAVNQIVGSYVRERYKGSTASSPVERAWQALRPALIGHMLARPFQALRPPKGRG